MIIFDSTLHVINPIVDVDLYCMTPPIHRISFSFTAVAKLAVPPGKWFCLARTGLGFSQYSCCVCGLHHEVFSKHWAELRYGNIDWRQRLETTLNNSLIELDYGQTTDTKEIEVMRERILNMVQQRENYFVNASFVESLEAFPRGTFGILTDGPSCLVNLAFPDFPMESIHVNKSTSTTASVAQFSHVHVGTNESDIKHVPQTKFLISRKKFQNLPTDVRVYPRLTPEVMKLIIDES